MARIRTVKPEMWTDGKVVRLSDAANLLFVALLNQADDSGRLKNDPKEIECRAPRFWERSADLIKELVAVGLVSVYGVSGQFLEISNFNKHQVIDRPRPSEIPSPKGRRGLVEHSTQGKEGKGVEGKGKEGKYIPRSGEPGIEAHIKSDHARVIEHIAKTYQAIKGVKCGFGGREGKVIKDILYRFTAEQTMGLWDKFLAQSWDWMGREGTVKVPHTIINFKSKIEILIDDYGWKEWGKKYEIPIPSENLKKISDLAGRVKGIG